MTIEGVGACPPLNDALAEVSRTVMLVSVCVTVTVLVVVVELPDESATVTRNTYDPAAANVAVVLLAAAVPLAENATAPGGVPASDQVYVSAPLPKPLGAAA